MFGVIKHKCQVCREFYIRPLGGLGRFNQCPKCVAYELKYGKQCPCGKPKHPRARTYCLDCWTQSRRHVEMLSRLTKPATNRTTSPTTAANVPMQGDVPTPHQKGCTARFSGFLDAVWFPAVPLDWRTVPKPAPITLCYTGDYQRAV